MPVFEWLHGHLGSAILQHFCVIFGNVSFTFQLLWTKYLLRGTAWRLWRTSLCKRENSKWNGPPAFKASLPVCQCCCVSIKKALAAHKFGEWLVFTLKFQNRFPPKILPLLQSFFRDALEQELASSHWEAS